MSLTRADPSFTPSLSLCLSPVTAGILLKSYIFPLPLNTIETFLLKCKCCGRTFLSLGFYYIIRSSLRLLRELCDWQNYNNFSSRGLYHLTRNLSPAARRVRGYWPSANVCWWRGFASFDLPFDLPFDCIFPGFRSLRTYQYNVFIEVRRVYLLFFTCTFRFNWAISFNSTLKSFGCEWSRPLKSRLIRIYSN